MTRIGMVTLAMGGICGMSMTTLDAESNERPEHLKRHKLQELILAPNRDQPDSYDSGAVECPMVIRWQDRWLMFHTAIRYVDGKADSTLGVAVSDDLVHWKEEKQILARGPEGAFDHGGVSGPFVWAEGDKLRMIYIGFPALGYETRPGLHGLAESTDGLNWKRVGDGPIHGVGPKGTWNDEVVFKPFVLKRGGEYWMFYNAYGTPCQCEQIGLAISRDLKNWKEHPDNPLLRRGDPEKDRDHRIIGDPWIMKKGDAWEMYYFAYDGQHARECLATSDDLIHWSKSPLNPIMDVGPEGSYDSVHCHKPCIIEHEGVVYHFYTAVGTDKKGRHTRAIALATSKRLPGVKYRDE